jgi:hypothetical protein
MVTGMSLLLSLALSLGLFWVVSFFIRRKRRWYKINLASNDVIFAYRTSRERWMSNDKYPKFRLDDNGHLITFPSEAHWILMWEQIPDAEVNMVRQQIREAREARAKRLSLEEEIG